MRVTVTVKLNLYMEYGDGSINVLNKYMIPQKNNDDLEILFKKWLSEKSLSTAVCAPPYSTTFFCVVFSMKPLKTKTFWCSDLCVPFCTSADIYQCQ